jgi:tetratricopeptide (TPR) repeat protein
VRDVYHLLGDIYYDQARYDKTEEYALQALRIGQLKLGQHPRVLSTFMLLGSVYARQHKHPQALEMLSSALKMEHREEGHYTLGSTSFLNSIANIFGDQDKNERKKNTKKHSEFAVPQLNVALSTAPRACYAFCCPISPVIMGK